MHLLVVEDERDLAQMMTDALRSEGFATDSVQLVEDAEAALRLGGFDAVVLDLGLPDGDGTALLKKIRRDDSHLPILIVTARDTVEDRVSGLNAGADDYLLKPFHTAELVARVKALLRRPGRSLGTALVEGNLALDTNTHQVRVADRALNLTRREFALLELLLRRAPGVVSKEQIETSLYNFDDDIGSNAIEVLMHRLRQRLQEAKASVAIHTVRGVGYLLTTPHA